MTSWPRTKWTPRVWSKVRNSRGHLGKTYCKHSPVRRWRLLLNRYLDSIRADTHKLLGTQGAMVCSAAEIMGLIEIGDQSGLLGCHPSAAWSARSKLGMSMAGEHREPAEMIGRLFGGLGDDGHTRAGGR